VKPKKPTTHVKDWEKDVVYLFQFTLSPRSRTSLRFVSSLSLG